MHYLLGTARQKETTKNTRQAKEVQIRYHLPAIFSTSAYSARFLLFSGFCGFHGSSPFDFDNEPLLPGETSLLIHMVWGIIFVSRPDQRNY